MKNKGLIIFLMILLLVVVIGLIGVLVLALNGKIVFSEGRINFGGKSTEIVLDKVYEVPDIENIEIKSNAGDLKVEKSNTPNIRVVAYGEKSDDIQVINENGNFVLDYTQNKKGWSLFGSNKNDVTIYIPEDYIGKVKINNDYGNCEICDLENCIIEVDCDYGNTTLGKVKDAIVKCDYGNIEIEEINEKCELKADCGNIKVQKMYITQNSNIRADMGNIDIKEVNDIYVDADVDLGKSNIYKNNKDSNITLKIRCDLGNVSVGK